mgnify:CR=1 FL=1
MSGKNYFILVASDAQNLDDERVPAYSVAKRRLEQKVWPLYSRTKNKRHLSKNDECVIPHYAAEQSKKRRESL